MLFKTSSLILQFFSKPLLMCSVIYMYIHDCGLVTAFIFNRPFLSSLVPLCQSESKCKTILMKMTLICMKMKLHAELVFIMKGFALGLVFKTNYPWKQQTSPRCKENKVSLSHHSLSVLTSPHQRIFKSFFKDCYELQDSWESLINNSRFLQCLAKKCECSCKNP